MAFSDDMFYLISEKRVQKKLWIKDVTYFFFLILNINLLYLSYG